MTPVELDEVDVLLLVVLEVDVLVVGVVDVVVVVVDGCEVAKYTPTPAATTRITITTTTSAVDIARLIRFMDVGNYKKVFNYSRTPRNGLRSR